MARNEPKSQIVAVRFGRSADILAAGEGVETMLALKSVLPRLPMAAGLSANHLAALELPPALCRLYVARDNDAAGVHAAERLREHAARLGMSANSSRSITISTSISAVSAAMPCALCSRTNSSHPTARDFCPTKATQSGAVRAVADEHGQLFHDNHFLPHAHSVNYDCHTKKHGSEAHAPHLGLQQRRRYRVSSSPYLPPPCSKADACQS
jgi:hypothetical protein